MPSQAVTAVGNIENHIVAIWCELQESRLLYELSWNNNVQYNAAYIRCCLEKNSSI